MQLISGGQIIDSGCRVILDFESCSIQDRHTGALLGAGPRCHHSQGLWELIGFTFPPLPPPPVCPPQTPCLRTLLNMGIIVLVTYAALASHL